MTNLNIRQYIGLNTLSVVFALILNFLAISLPINNKTTGELSDSYPNLFVPSGFTFSIWGIIYLLMITFLIYQAWQYQKSKSHTLNNIKTIGPWFFISGLANGSWIIAWHYEMIFISLIIMLVLFYSLLKIYLLLLKNRPQTLGDNLFISLFFSVYLGWISVATIANFTTILVSYGWTGGFLNESTWATIMIIIATILGILMIFKFQDIPYAVVILWALYGIYAKQSVNSDATSSDVANAAKYALTLLSINTVLNIFGKRFYIFDAVHK